mgnify:CR=1 FL=1
MIDEKKVSVDMRCLADPGLNLTSNVGAENHCGPGYPVSRVRDISPRIGWLDTGAIVLMFLFTWILDVSGFRTFLPQMLQFITFRGIGTYLEN